MKFVALFLSVVFMSQTVAFAMDPVEASANSERAQMEMQRNTRAIESRYEKLSDARKLKYLNKQERRLNKIQNQLVKMSDKKFERIKHRLEKIEMDAEDQKLSTEELAIYTGDENTKIATNENGTIVKSMQKLNKKDLMDRNLQVIEQIQTEKEDVLNRLAGIASTKKKSASRSVASVECPNAIYGIIVILVFGTMIVGLFLPMIMAPIILMALGASAATLIVCFILGTWDSSPSYEWRGFN
jgi:predicted transcriptional regulator